MMFKEMFSKVTVANVMPGVVAGVALAFIVYGIKRLPASPVTGVLQTGANIVKSD